MNETLFPQVSSSSTSSTHSVSPALPHHRLLAYGVAVELLLAVRRASLRDAKLRDEALRSAKSACLNCAKGAGRLRAVTRRAPSPSPAPRPPRRLLRSRSQPCVATRAP